MEIVFAIVIMTLAAGGLGLGLALGRAPARTSCGAAEGLAKARCADCPLRKRVQEKVNP